MITHEDVFSSGLVFEQLADSVFDWASDRGILLENGATIEGQVRKLLEEASEVAEEIENGNDLSTKLEIGDVLVTLLMLCRFKGYDLVECLNLTLHKINKRTGYMKDGVFVKDTN